MNRERPDVLLVSPGTTEGWRRADAELADVLRELGVSVSVVGSEMRFARHFRRTMQLTDLAEAAAMRWALSRALRRTQPASDPVLHDAVHDAATRRAACAMRPCGSTRSRR